MPFSVFVSDCRILATELNDFISEISMILSVISLESAKACIFSRFDGPTVVWQNTSTVSDKEESASNAFTMLSMLSFK